jgi:hypothetical protein
VTTVQEQYGFGAEILIGGELKKRYYFDWDGVYYNKTFMAGPKGGQTLHMEGVKLANFDARIVEEHKRDDGLEITREYLINCKLLPGGAVLPPLNVPVDEFAMMKWAYSYDVRAIVEPHSALRDILRAAIQERSRGDYETRTIYTHTGWTKLNDNWVFLHAGGAITADGLDDTISVELAGKLQNYDLPAPSVETLSIDFTKLIALLNGIADAFGLVGVGYTLRPIMNEIKHAQCTHWYLGPTQLFKTALAAVLQAFYGANFRSDTLPIGWDSTQKATARKGSVLKDALMTVDDFRPGRTEKERRELYSMADLLIRGNANVQGRERLTQAAEEGRYYPPRSGLRSTGELPPVGESLRGRMCLQKVKKGTVPKPWLDKAQRDAKEGVFARLTAAYIQWLAPRLDRCDIMRGEDYWRDEFAYQLGRDAYARTAANLAECYVGFAHFVAFGVMSGAMTRSEGHELCKRCRVALLEVGYEQENYIRQEEATEEFIAMLRGALEGKMAWLQHSGNDESEWGFAYGSSYGVCIGYYDSPTEKVWLKGDVAYKVVREFAQKSGVEIGKASDIWAALADKGLLKLDKTEEHRYTVRRTIPARERGDNRLKVRELDAKVVMGGE